MFYEIHRVTGAEWRSLRELRLRALSDTVSRIAFGSTYEQEASFPEAGWRRRADLSEQAAEAVTYVARTGRDGDRGDAWVGMVTVLNEGLVAERQQGLLVGVYVLPEHRGRVGPAGALITAAVRWSVDAWKSERIRLYVHEDNPRAGAFYRRLGFSESGERIPAAHQEGRQELELELWPG